MARPLFVKPQNSSEWKSSNAQYVKENSSWEKGLLWVKVNGIWEHDHEFTEYVQIQTPTCIKQDIYAYQCICKLDGSMSGNHYGSVDLSNHDSDAERVFSQTVNTNSTQHTKQYTCKACGVHDTSWDELENHTPFKAWTYDNDSHWHECLSVTSGCDAQLNKAKHEAESEWQKNTNYHWHWCTSRCGIYLNKEEHDDVSISYGLNVNDTEDEKDQRHWRVRNCWTCNLAEYLENEPHTLISSYSSYMDTEHLTTTWCELCGRYTKENVAEAHSFLTSNQPFTYDDSEHYRECIQCQTPDYGGNGPHERHTYGTFSGKLDYNIHTWYCATDGCDWEKQEAHTKTWNSNSSQHWKQCEVCGAGTGVNGNNANSFPLTTPESHSLTTSYSPYMDLTHLTNEWCTVCNYYTKSNEEEYHSFVVNTNQVYVYDFYGHWKECTLCGQSGEYGEHVDSGYIPDPGDNSLGHCAFCTVCNYLISPTQDHYSDWENDNSYHWKYCDACNYTMVAPTSHSFSGWKTNEDYHWQKCSVCDPNGEDYLNYASHVEPSTWATDSSKHYKYCESGCGYLLKSGPHTGSMEWSTNATYHWHDCTTCGYDVDKAEHTIPSVWSDYDTSNHYKYCEDGCGYMVDSGSHTASSTWSTNSSYHWHECSAGCGYDMDKEIHTLPNYWSQGDYSKHYKYCEGGCGYVMAEGLHQASSQWFKDTDYHWHECTACDRVMDMASHSVPTYWTSFDTSRHYKYCADGCGQLVDSDSHTPSNDWSSNATYHWKDCTAGCGYEMSKDTHNPQSYWGFYDGTYHYKYCDDCGRNVETEVHTPSSVWSTDNNYHWHECSANCGYDMDKDTHSGSWSFVNDNYHHKLCSTCDYTINGNTPHDAVGGWEYSDTWHWKRCSTCNGQLYYNHHTTPTSWTNTGDGSYHYKYCVCGKQMSRGTHSGSYDWDTSNHWKNCSSCGYSIEGPGAHSGSWTTSETHHSMNCSTCGYTMVSSTTHNLGAWDYSSTWHWKDCGTCGYRAKYSHHSTPSTWNDTDSSNHYKKCTDGCGYTISSGAHTPTWDCDETNHWKNCSACGYTMESPSPHSMTVTSDANYEYYTCSSGCGYSNSFDHSPSYTGWSQHPNYTTYHVQTCSSCGYTWQHKAGSQPNGVCSKCDKGK